MSSTNNETPAVVPRQAVKKLLQIIKVFGGSKEKTQIWDSQEVVFSFFTD